MYCSFDLSAVTLEELQIFITAASNLSFTKTAEQLNLSQPVISKKIALLESTLHLKLFVRWRRTLKLTYSGEVLADYCRKMLEGFAEEVTRAQRHQNEKESQVVIAFSHATYPYHIGAYFSALHPDKTIKYLQVGYYDMLRAVQSGDADFAFYGNAGIEIFSHPPLSCKRVAEIPLWVFMLKDNPLSSRGEIDLLELSEQTFLMLHPSVSPWNNYFVSLCQDAGFSPNVSGYYTNTNVLGMSLQDNNTVFISDLGATPTYEQLGLAAIPLRNCTNSSHLIWNENGVNTWLAEDLLRASRSYWSKEPRAKVCD